jgi:hypothetical protein
MGLVLRGAGVVLVWVSVLGWGLSSVFAELLTFGFVVAGDGRSKGRGGDI